MLDYSLKSPIESLPAPSFALNMEDVAMDEGKHCSFYYDSVEFPLRFLDEYSCSL